jgi:tRNA (mo5U34)-methyltransferase
MDISEFRQRAVEYAPILRARKELLAPADEWYPYGTLNNFNTLEELLSGEHRDLSRLLDTGPIADIGAADGDLSFLLHSMGYDVDIIDNGATNWNGLRGARLLAADVGSGVTVHEIDLDSQFQLPRRYGVAFFLGILYHLQNPFYALLHLARSARYAFLSTKIAQVTADGTVRLDRAPVAYLLAADECNNDATNYWIFSDAGVRRLLDRTGWEVLASTRGGCTTDSDPASLERDERAFYYLRSRVAVESAV